MKYWPFAAAMMLIIADQWLFMGMCKELRNPIGAAIKYAGDAAVILLPYWYLPPRWRWTVIAPVWGLTLLLTCSSWNFRAFYDILSPMALTMTGNVNSTVLPSIISLIRPADFIFIALAAGFTFCIFRYRRSFNAEKMPLKVKIAALPASVALFFLSQAALTWSHRNYFRHDIGIDVTLKEATRLRLSEHIFTHIGDYEANGLLVHSWRAAAEALDYLHIHRELTDGQRREIAGFLSETVVAPDSAATANRNRNVIIVLVESLNSYAIETVIDGHEVTPNLRRLIGEQGSVSALNVVSQVADGTSSDGQLLTNTGLLPLRRGVVGLMVGSSNRFMALPERLQRASSTVVFGENGATWNKIPTFVNWGFTPYTVMDFQQEAADKGIDGALMDFALGLIPELKQPFLLELVTMSSHMPFTLDGLTPPAWLVDADGMESIEHNYLTTIHYFDAQLGRLIDALKEQGIWENTILIVASDHSMTNALPKGHEAIYPADLPMSFIAANTHLTARIGRTVGQVDIFPTILYLTGYYAEGDYNGLGTPIVSDELQSAYTYTRGLIGDDRSPLADRQLRAAEISELIVRGDYFREQSNLE
ncbi:MAG: LTA synthase family protein [Muribaculaceae bacterium]|nr:LTA synthase family protein [Muribaculaceae bacterium]